MTEVDRLGWAVTVPMRSGGYVLGVRANLAGLAALLRALFADRVVDGAEPPGNLSVWLAERTDGGPQDLHRLYVTYSRMLRTRSVRRALEALWHELGARDHEHAGDRLLVDATVLAKDGRAHLFPARLRRSVIDDLRRWESRGFRLSERRLVELDVEAGEVVVPAVRWPVDGSEVADAITQLGLDDRPDGDGVAGRLRIESWTVGPGEQPPAGRVMLAAAQVVDRPRHVDPSVLRRLSGLLGEATDLGPDWTGTDELRRALHRLGAG